MTAPVSLLNHRAAAYGEAAPDACSSSYSGQSYFTSLPAESNHDTIPCHPLGVKPSGNGWVAAHNLRRAIGAFMVLPDEVLLILLEHFGSSTILKLGCTCKALYAFARSEDVWKSLFIR
jgi:F-box-like